MAQDGRSRGRRDAAAAVAPRHGRLGHDTAPADRHAAGRAAHTVAPHTDRHNHHRRQPRRATATVTGRTPSRRGRSGRRRSYLHAVRRLRQLRAGRLAVDH